MLSSIILSIGDELTLGQTVDTNSAWLARELAGIGVEVSGHVTVPDSRDAIAAAIRTAAAAADLLVISGGLGPTEDDLTRDALADAMGVDLLPDEEAIAAVRAFFAARGRPMPQRNEVQGYVPRGARAIPNANGTAPGLAAALGHCRVVVMPGVPKEMFAMWRTQVLPELGRLGGGAVILSRTLHTFGSGESAVAERLGPLMDRKRNPSVGTTVANNLVSLRVNARAPSLEQAKRELEETDRACRAALGTLIFGADEETLTGVVGALLRASGKSVATAESCTGGLLAKYLTDVPGSSAYFSEGFVTYSNASKTKVLGVPAETIERYGAVSEPVARAMAEGALQASGADLAVGITGVAGPDGGSPTKPVGTVCLSLAAKGKETQTRTFLFVGDREMIRDRSAKMGLSLVRYHLVGEPSPF